MHDGNLNTLIYRLVTSYSKTFQCNGSSGGSKEGARGAGEPGLPLILGKKRENHRKKKSRQDKQKAKKQPPALLAQGLYPLLGSCTGSSDIIMG